MTEQTKAIIVLKAALEFNANVVIIATKAIANDDYSKMKRELKQNFEMYKRELERISK